MFQFENSIRLLVIGISVLCTVFQPSVSQSVKKEMTFYKEKASWNTASNVCRVNGGRLVTLDNQLKIQKIEIFKENEWNNAVNGDYWIGLFDASISSGTYTWSDCTRLDDSVTNWHYLGEPDHLDTDHCVRNTEHGGYWRTKECSKAYQFICEKILGYCASNGGDCFIARTDASDIPECLSDDNNTPHGCSAYGHMSSYRDLPPPVDDLCKPTSMSPAITSESLLITSFDPGMSQTPPLYTAPSPNAWHTSTPTCSLISPAITSESLLTSFDPGMSQTPPLYTATSPRTGHTSSPTSSLLLSRTPEENLRCVEMSPNTDVMISNTVSPSSTTPKENSETATQNANDKSSSCSSPKKTMSAEESFDFTSKILKDLEIQKYTLSSYRRKRISAPEDRLIARVEGYIGVVSLVVIFGGVFILDLPALSRNFMMMLHRIRDVIQ